MTRRHSPGSIWDTAVRLQTEVSRLRAELERTKNELAEIYKNSAAAVSVAQNEADELHRTVARLRAELERTREELREAREVMDAARTYREGKGELLASYVALAHALDRFDEKYLSRTPDTTESK